MTTVTFIFKLKREKSKDVQVLNNCYLTAIFQRRVLKNTTRLFGLWTMMIAAWTNENNISVPNKHITKRVTKMALPPKVNTNLISWILKHNDSYNHRYSNTTN